VPVQPNKWELKVTKTEKKNIKKRRQQQKIKDRTKKKSSGLIRPP